MQQPIATAGQQDVRTYGPYKVILSLPVDGGFSINVHAATSAHRYDELCFTVADVDLANLIHRVIREGGEQGVQPEGIHAALLDTLTGDLHTAQRRRDADSRQRAARINRLLDQLDTPADRAAIADIAQTMRAGSFRELRDAHAAALDAARKGGAR